MLISASVAVADADFCNKVTVALLAYALSAGGEIVVAGHESRHAKRQALADRITSNPRGEATRFAWGIGSFAAIRGTIEATGVESILDSDIEWAITQIFDDYAGVTAAEAA
jgi:hypothetical protein